MDPITERCRVNGPYVYGYLRDTTRSTARHTALSDALAEYCRQHELTLCGLFTERAARAEARSPAFVGLIDALGVPDAYGVVVPARVHLGPKSIAAERERQLAELRVRLIVVRPTGPRRGVERASRARPIMRQRGIA
ncbi:hypothetical protein [Streptomyces sp. NPDC002402]